jgi:hypothetical protein
MTTAPPVIRMPRWWARNSRSRSASPRPASAKNSYGTAVPSANAMVSTNVRSPKFPSPRPR